MQKFFFNLAKFYEKLLKFRDRQENYKEYVWTNTFLSNLRWNLSNMRQQIHSAKMITNAKKFIPANNAISMLTAWKSNARSCFSKVFTVLCGSLPISLELNLLNETFRIAYKNSVTREIFSINFDPFGNPKAPIRFGSSSPQCNSTRCIFEVLQKYNKLVRSSIRTTFGRCDKYHNYSVIKSSLMNVVKINVEKFDWYFNCVINKMITLWYFLTEWLHNDIFNRMITVVAKIPGPVEENKRVLLQSFS